MSVTHQVRRVSILSATAVTAIIAFGAPHPVHAAATIVVDTVTDEDMQNADCSLREAIVAANVRGRAGRTAPIQEVLGA